MRRRAAALRSTSASCVTGFAKNRTNPRSSSMEDGADEEDGKDKKDQEMKDGEDGKDKKDQEMKDGEDKGEKAAPSSEPALKPAAEEATVGKS